MSAVLKTMHRRATALWRLLRLLVWLLVTAAAIVRRRRPNAEAYGELLTRRALRLLHLLNIRLRVHGPAPPPGPVLMVANHVSWLDIFVLMSLYPSGFIAKQSIRCWPVIGPLAERVGTVFIDRHSRKDAGMVAASIAQALKRGQKVTFFPEARTSDGTNVLPFKAALFQAAVDTATPVQALALRYETRSGTRCTDAAWVGDTPLLTALWRIARQPQLVVQVDCAPSIGADAVRDSDRFSLKEASEHFVRSRVCRA